MAIKRRGLGRGLDALLGETRSAGLDDDGELRNLPLDMIRRGKYQPRIDMRPETLGDLANSIRAQGVVQPIVVRALAENAGYEIIAGERRWRAAQLAGLHEIPAVVRNVPDQGAIAMALIENIQREDLNPLEEAVALQRLIDEFDMTHELVAEAIGRSRAAVSNLLRLLSLNKEVKTLLQQGELEMGHARALLALQGDAQTEAARAVATRNLSVRETEQLVRHLQTPIEPHTEPRTDPNIRRLQEELAEKLGASVTFQHGARGKGTLLIHYTSLDELEGILTHIK